MNYPHRYYCALALTIALPPALAANKCVEESGRIFYQEAPCPANTHGGDMHLNVNRSVTGQAKPPPPVESVPALPAAPENPSADKPQNAPVEPIPDTASPDPDHQQPDTQPPAPPQRPLS